ncbi:MAG: hypothetical protein KAV01_01605 [Candidatus Lokiarchaeota archaeon]|nr:hypothetical protein [Candidatus Lokiarchaeota archaeon]MCK4479196.1 hypothetical protein [Candidatus Lokiarchaeota archaeon]
MTRKEKIVLIGAGSMIFGSGAVANIMDSEVLEGSTICLHDINAKSLELMYQACQSAIDEKKSNITLESTINRLDALRNATFIINSIEITPRFDFMEMDYSIPLKFGCKQVSGENGGPGGLFHSLRVIPPILKICEDIQKVCPNAFIINFSNPMSRVCLAIKRKFPSLRLVGLCHEIMFCKHYLPPMLGTPYSNLEFKAGGLNHFGVILEIKYRDTGEDAYPDIRKRGPEYIRNIQLWDTNLTAFILEKYGYLPYTYDSHYGEYMRWAWDLSDIEKIRNFWKGYAEKSIKKGIRLERQIRKGKGAKIIKPDEESAIPIIEGILTDANYEEPSVNLPNNDVITNLPRDLVVECPAIVNKKGLTPVKLGEYPKGLAALLRTQASVQDLVVEAVITKSREIALQALLADPVIDGYDQAEKILDEMLRLQGEYIQLK